MIKLTELIKESSPFDRFTIKVHRKGNGTEKENGMGSETGGFGSRDFEYKGTIKRDIHGWHLYDVKNHEEDAGPFRTLESLMDYFDLEKQDLTGDYVKNLR